MTSTLCTAFLSRLPASRSTRQTPSAELEAALAAILQSARVANPRIDMPTESFLAYLARRAGTGGELIEHLRALPAADLYLACACLHGVPGAIERFEALYVAAVDAGLSHLRLAPADTSELKQQLRVKLLVGQDGAAPKLALYAGTGPLASWLRRVALREALMFLRKGKREEPKQDLLTAATAAGDLEIDFLKQRYQDDFREAFVLALRGLTVRERNLLRQQFIYGMKIEEIGALYRVSRATAARWLAQVRAEVLSQTRKHLGARLRLKPSEIDSLLALLRSHCDLSIRRLLDSAAASPKEKP